MHKQEYTPGGMPLAVNDGRYIWVGQLLPWQLPGGGIPPGIEAQAKQLWQNLGQMLASCGSSRAGLLRVTVTVADERLLAAAQKLFCQLAGAGQFVFCWRVGRFSDALLALDAVALARSEAD